MSRSESGRSCESISRMMGASRTGPGIPVCTPRTQAGMVLPNACHPLSSRACSSSMKQLYETVFLSNVRRCMLSSRLSIALHDIPIAQWHVSLAIERRAPDLTTWACPWLAPGICEACPTSPKPSFYTTSLVSWGTNQSCQLINQFAPTRLIQSNKRRIGLLFQI